MASLNGQHIPEDERHRSASEYLKWANDANDAGNSTLSMHLYLAAFERLMVEDGSASPEGLNALRKAWDLALQNKERALAEYIFEKMEGYLSADEIAQCAEDLQGLALDKLEEFGLSRSDLEQVSAALSQEFLGEHPSFFSLDSSTLGLSSLTLSPQQTAPSDTEVNNPSNDDLNHDDSSSEDKSDITQLSSFKKDDSAKHTSELKPRDLSGAAAMFAQAASSLEEPTQDAEVPAGYDDLIGYDGVIRVMREIGIGIGDDPDFQNLVKLLNRRHGLNQAPAPDTILFRAPAREDANYFLMATLGELKLPAVRMHMEETIQGLPVLCVTAQADSPKRLSTLRENFQNGGVLILEDIDLWSSPLTETTEDMNGFFMMQMSRGAREAMNLIRGAVENPRVYVLASCSEESDINGFFLDLLEPVTVVPIDHPTDAEREDIWMDLMHRHPSLRAVALKDLVRFSASMPRFDIYMAAREAMEEAYKIGLMMRRYEPVTRENLLEKLAAYHPLDSALYRQLEDAIIAGFSQELESLDDLLDES